MNQATRLNVSSALTEAWKPRTRADNIDSFHRHEVQSREIDAVSTGKAVRSAESAARPCGTFGTAQPTEIGRKRLEEFRMGQERPFAQLASASVCLGLLLLMLPGCALLNGFLDPTDVGRFPSSYMENGIRRVLTPRDTPPGIADAEEPRPEDLVPIYEDYRIVPGDQIAVTIMNLLIQGAQWAASLEVSPTGYIRVAELGMLKVSGRTEQEVELELVERLKEADLLPNPSVQAFMQVKRNRTYMMIGSVAAPGPYPIATPDLRLLEAIGFARDVSPTVKRLYIIRQENGGVRPAEAIPQDMPREDGLIIPPPDDEDIDAAASELNFFLDVAAGQEATSAPSTQQPTKSELEQIIAPKQATPPATQEGRDRPERPFAPIIFDPQTGEIVEVRLNAETLEIWYAQRCIETLPRKRGEGKACINYRHIIDWLVRKPGAFANYQYREKLFPSSHFRMAYDALKEQKPQKADKEYLRILELAAKESECRVEDALGFLLGKGETFSFEGVKDLVLSKQKIPAPTEVFIDPVDLGLYDELLNEEEEPSDPSNWNRSESQSDGVFERVAVEHDPGVLRAGSAESAAGIAEL